MVCNTAGAILTSAFAIKEQVMIDKDLIWHEQCRRTVFETRIFSVGEAESVGPGGQKGTFSLVSSRPWALVMPVLITERGREFVMVRQWRHGAREISVEFPGGVIESGEAVDAGIRRELREETGYTAKKWTLLGTMNPNPAFMENMMSFYLAEDLEYAGTQELDSDEFVSVETHPVETVISAMGTAPYIHALMAAGLSFFLKHPC